ncbi:hypothetical protein TRFO_39014 [Tritrichomonas foetus]|uniref:Uncharacterized protein n=1 Tax=Tritrichomonas foetus TaxID=1144522 RepID=A0A1J4J977_9EUKA|nr:hypothetical protein TRFO_39014 [Tritrichomonas foetus]|eukprot:OHS94799.1 hypothetical protein TRFO_39014 [Tritrichomonas foetus]
MEDTPTSDSPEIKLSDGLDASNSDVDLEVFEKGTETFSSKIRFWLNSFFQPNFTLSLLSITFVIERSGLAPSSLFIFYAFVAHYFLEYFVTKLLKSRKHDYLLEFFTAEELPPIFPKLYAFFVHVYHICLNVYILLLLNDVLYQPFQAISPNFLLKYKKAISIIVFSFFNLISLGRDFPKSLILVSFIACSTIFYLACHSFYRSIVTQEGSNRSLQIDSMNENVLSLFCFCLFSFGFPPILNKNLIPINNPENDEQEMSVLDNNETINGALNPKLIDETKENKQIEKKKKRCQNFGNNLLVFLKLLVLATVGITIYAAYGRYINTTQFFSFSMNNTIANICRVSYFLVFLLSSVNSNFKLNVKSDYSTILSKLVISVLLSLLVEASLPFAVLCGVVNSFIIEILLLGIASLIQRQNLSLNTIILTSVFILMAGIIGSFVIYNSIFDIILYYK